MSAGGDAGFDFGDGVIDDFNGAAAVAAFVVLGSFQSGFRFAQMRQGSPHVGLIRPNGLKTHRRDHRHQNQTRSKCFHSVTCSGKIKN
jgi:hypothetical protein